MIKVFVVLLLGLLGAWAIAAGAAFIAAPLWVGAVHLAGKRTAADGIDEFFALLVGGLVIAVMVQWVWQSLFLPMLR